MALWRRAEGGKRTQLEAVKHEVAVALVQTNADSGLQEGGTSQGGRSPGDELCK